MKHKVKSIIIANIFLCLIFSLDALKKTSAEPTKSGYAMADDGKLFYQQFGDKLAALSSQALFDNLSAIVGIFLKDKKF